MASAEIENQPESLQRESVNEPVTVADELNASKTSELSHPFESKLSTIVEEGDSSVETVPSATYHQEARFDKLARPKVLHLEETLQRLEKTMNNEMSERVAKIKMRLFELRGSEKHTSQEQTGESSTKLSDKSKAIYNKLQSSLRKVAFEMLVKQIFDKMPELIVSMQHSRAQQLAPEMKPLLDTVWATLVYYLGQPSNEHEERVFNHLCFGLAKFIENIIENVHRNQHDGERVARDGSSGNGHFPVAVQLARKAYKER